MAPQESNLLNNLAAVEDPDALASEARGELLRNLGVEDEASKKNCSLYGDSPAQMTSGRLLARFLSRFRWYYPRREGGPDLDKAWAHYEHMTLARIYSDEPPGTYVRAPFGERKRPTKLYPVWATPTKSLNDFGVSVRLYFSTLLALSTFLGIAGLLNLPLISYFWSNRYSSGTEGLVPAVRSSAVCVDTSWVECDTCAADMSQDRLFYDQDAQTVYALKNDCNFDDWLWQGVLSWGASILLVVQFAVAFFWLQPRAEVSFDEDIQTASDYSVRIGNPPKNAVDPDEWHGFFKKFGHVSFVTVSIDNAQLLNKLISHKRTRMQLARKLPPDCDIWDKEQVDKVLASLSSSWSLPFLPNAVTLWKKLLKIQAEVEELARQPYKAVSVFVTFETERAQRNALHALTASKLSLWRDKVDISRFDENKQMRVYEKEESSRMPESLWDLVDEPEDNKEVLINLPQSESLSQALGFRGKHVLRVTESPEPNDIRWTDLQVSFGIRFVKFVGTTLAVIWFMHWSAYFISALHSENPGSFVIPLFIAVTNVLVPKICDFINKFESHATEGKRQASLYAKVALFRWFNSGIAILLIIGFTDTISFNPINGGDNLSQMAYQIIFAELVTIPVIKLIDVMGFIRKHILGPRAEDQEEMNSYFSGGRFELAERYTDCVKVLFVALFYSPILPSSLFLGAFALMTHFIVAKFAMMRMWRSSPDVGASLSGLSRNYFFSIALLLHIMMSAWWWSGYPYDLLCKGDDGVYNYCNQDFLRSFVFPPVPEKQPDDEHWMSESQATITSLYGWTAVTMLVCGVGFFIKENIWPFLQSMFCSTYEPDGADQQIPFGTVKHLAEVMAYVPQLRIPGFSHPLLVSDISGIDDDVIGWKDDTRGFLEHSLVEEGYQILGRETDHIIFSPIKQWSVEEKSA